MRRLLPKSLLGQMILLMAAALLVAQLVNLGFLLTGQQKLSLAQSEGPAIGFFTEVAAQVAAADSPEEQDLLIGNRSRRRLRLFTIDADSLVTKMQLQRDTRLEARLTSALTASGLALREAHAARDMEMRAFPRFADRRRFRDDKRWQSLLFSARLPDGRWLNARLGAPRPDPWLLGRLSLATLVLYVLVLGAVFWIAARVVRPLRNLTRAAESFHGRREIAPVEPSGPSDLRRAIEAFNAMNGRVVDMLDEKDRMLGAIGHDLRTPLASLRIRAEAMEPEEERAALVRTIEEMSDTLEDILVLARTGRTGEPARRMDLSALADAAVEEFHALGVDAAFEESPRTVAEIQANLMRRAVRNLIDNAISYGSRARVRVVEDSSSIAVEVDDDGPGIPEDKVELATRSFARLEGSRSRETGGAGLGLAIARAVAEAHGGRLELVNRPEGGLRARLVVPS